MRAWGLVAGAGDITTVSTGETATMIRERMSQFGEEGRALLREALDGIDMEVPTA